MQKKEKIIRSIRTAELFVQRELRLIQLRALSAPNPVIVAEEGLVEKSRQELNADDLAFKLLPQAVERVGLTKEREEALEQTTLGVLTDAIAHLDIQSELKEAFTDSSPKFRFPRNQESWNALFLAVKSEQTSDVLFHLRALLSSSMIELLYVKLPPIAPPYDIDGLTFNLPIERIN